MAVPSSNILKSALRLIKRQTVTHYAWTGRTPNAIGYDVDSYAAPATITGSFQPVSRTRYAALGLDFSKSYITFYTESVIRCIERDRSGDIIAFNGRRYKCESPTEWNGIDGWNSVYAVDIGADSGAINA